LKKQISKWLSILLPIALGVFLIIYTYNKFTPQQLEEIKFQFKNAEYKYILLSLLFGFVALLSRAYRWSFTLEPLGYQPKLLNTFMAVCVGYFMNMTVPRSGEISRALVLKKYEEIPFDKGFGTIIAERIVDMFILLSFIATAFFLQYEIFESFVLDKISPKQLLLLGFIGLTGLLAFVLIFKYSKNQKIVAIKRKIAGLLEGFWSITKMEKKWAFFAHTLIIWGSYLVMFYVTIFALPETSNLSFNAVIIAFVVGGLAITLTNSGFGAYPFLIANILLFYNIPETAGNAFGWIVWTSQTLMIVILGTLSFLFLPLLNKNK
jgi:uncharacterized protein (TIRG00374 family)